MYHKGGIIDGGRAMGNATSVGKFLKKLRVERDEVMNDMAKKIGVSVSFLSSVETGKKKMPSSWVPIISKEYNLDRNQIEEFESAIARTEEEIELSISNLDILSREFAISFARKLPDLNRKQINKMRKIMEEDD